MKRKLSETVLKKANQQERFEYLKKLSSKKDFRRNLSFFLAGFFEGEGSLWVSVNKAPQQPFGIQLNFGFSVYQHKLNIEFLDLFLFYFQTGRIEKKSGSENVFQYVINSRITLLEKVKPFLSKYTIFGSKKDHSLFFEILENIQKEKMHLTKEGMIELVKKVYLLESLKGKKRKRTLEEILSFLDSH